MAAPEPSFTPDDLPEAVVRVAADGRIAGCNNRARQLLAGAGDNAE